MAFGTLDARLQVVAEKALAFCKNRYGGNGLKIEQGIDAQIKWLPTFYLRPTRFLILAVEVDDNLFPEALRGAALEITQYDCPISVFQVCPLSTYQADPKQGKVNLLRKHGFGIITVDDDGTVTLQHPCGPLAQHISAEELEPSLAELTPKLKVEFKRAHETYLANVGQGIQQVGQIVEGLITCLAEHAKKKNLISSTEASGALADTIDALYSKPAFKAHRAALGAARDFIKEYRNIASHPQKTAQQAMIKIQKCKAGFLRGVDVAGKLRAAMQQLGYSIKIHIT
jgi:hypothetical protein